MPSGREQWFADLVQAGLDTKVLVEADVLAHATPQVLTGALPKDVLVKVFESALGAGAISPKAVLATATPAVLAAHVSHDILWGCIATGAARASLVADGGFPTDEARELLRRALDSGLVNGTLTPADIVARVDSKVLVHALPDALTTKLLEVTLASGVMTPQVVVETVTTAAIAKYAPVQIVWSVIARAADELAAKSGEVNKPKATAHVVEESEIASILVELDDAVSAPVAAAAPLAGKPKQAHTVKQT